MKLLDYLEPMETLPNRFSNLAFWRVLRVFKDRIVDAFTYVNAWGTDIEMEQKTQNASLTSHGQMIADIKEEQIAQNANIGSNTTSIESLQTSVAEVATNVNSLIPLVYDGSRNFEVTTYTVTDATLAEIGSGTGMYTISNKNPTYIFPTIPHNVKCRAYFFVYDNEDRTSYTSVNIDLPYYMGTFDGTPYVTINTGYAYAPYGIRRLIGVYVTYQSHV